MSFADDLELPRGRLTLTNLDTTETVEAAFNPEEFRSSLTVNYGRRTPHRAARSRLHYSSTGNRTFELVLFHIGFTRREVGHAEDKRLFYESLCYRSRERNAIAPPLVLLVWPRLMTMVARVVSHGDEMTRFSRSGQPVVFTVRLGFEEALEEDLFSEDVRIGGYERPNAIWYE